MLFYVGQEGLADGLIFEQRPELSWGASYLYLPGDGPRQRNVKSKGVETKQFDMFKESQGMAYVAVAE